MPETRCRSAPLSPFSGALFSGSPYKPAGPPPETRADPPGASCPIWAARRRQVHIQFAERQQDFLRYQQDGTTQSRGSRLLLTFLGCFHYSIQSFRKPMVILLFFVYSHNRTTHRTVLRHTKGLPDLHQRFAASSTYHMPHQNFGIDTAVRTPSLPVRGLPD